MPIFSAESDCQRRRHGLDADADAAALLYVRACLPSAVLRGSVCLLLARSSALLVFAMRYGYVRDLLELIAIACIAQSHTAAIALLATSVHRVGQV